MAAAKFYGTKVHSIKQGSSKQAGDPPLIATLLSKSSVVDAAAIRFIWVAAMLQAAAGWCVPLFTGQLLWLGQILPFYGSFWYIDVTVKSGRRASRLLSQESFLECLLVPVTQQHRCLLVQVDYRIRANRTPEFYQIQGLFDWALWLFLAKNGQKWQYFRIVFLPNLTKLYPKRVSWCSNQEWRYICADTVIF